jgi:hypothetical protein
VERYRIKQLIADLLCQVLIDLLSQTLMRLAEWMAAAPWLCVMPPLPAAVMRATDRWLVPELPTAVAVVR